MTLLDNFTNGSFDPRVIGQVSSSIVQFAETVYTEGSVTSGHVARAAFATKVATGTVQFMPLVLSAATFASLTPASTDTTVNNAVATLWNLWAGA